MKEYLPVLSKCPLFDGLSEEERLGILGCLNAQVVPFRKYQTVFAEGDPAGHFGIVLSGSVQIVKEDFYGSRSIVGRAVPAELFCESFACAGMEALPVSVIAQEDGAYMRIDCRRLTVSCCNACSFHSRMIFNLLKVVAAGNLMFNQKLEITSRRTTRDKLMAYLMHQAKLQGSDSFTIPYDRQALADYLSVERSAMSAEIGKLRREGVLESERNWFRLLQKAEER